MLERGTYGVEWTPRPKDESSILGWLVVGVIVLALVSLVVTAVVRWRRAANEPAPPSEPAPAQTERIAAEERKPAAVEAPLIATNALPVPALARRPVKVRNLLMRLEEAEKLRDLEMAALTIEQIRALPGAPAADLDDALARRLGAINVRRLFGRKNAQWVVEVAVKSGSAATRIASEHGSSYAAMRRLNDKIDLSRVRAGQKVFVLNHPRFNLVVHRRLRMADLQLNGKFFKRYDLTAEPKQTEGAYEWREVALPLKAADRAELDTLLTKSVSVVVSEM